MVGFAFALAHMLVEAKIDGEITYATGTSCGLVNGPADMLVGKNLLDLAAQEDRAFLTEVLKRIGNRQSTPAVRVTLRGPTEQDRSFMLGGIRLEDEEILSIGLVAMTRQAKRGDGAADRLIQTAIEHATQGPDSGGGDDGLMMFVIDGIADMIRKGPIEAVLPVLEKLRAYLRAVSVEGDAFKDIGSGKFGLIRAAGVSREEVQAGIKRILDEFNIYSGIKIYDLSFDLSMEKDSLSEEDVARAISYSIKRFSEDTPESFDIRSLRDGANAILRDTARRMTTARQMLRQHNIDIVYQPIVRLDDGKVHHLEALSRISGVESIGAWMRFAEESGLIRDFDLMVTAKIAKSLEDHAKAGWMPRIAINLSASSLQSSLFLSHFEAALEPYSAFRKQLLIEVTETVAITDFPKMAETLMTLRRKGHAICLDDVGAGATSFETLQSLPADFTKIDGSVLRGLASGKVHAATMHTIIKMAQNKGSEVIVEHLETQSQIRTVREMGAHFGQGYIFGRPVSDASAASIPQSVQADPHWSPIAHDKPVAVRSA
ncbi:MAG TPA: EAL domain-containing protein [Stellaceae bacterium]|nr:EAL domain-containing protein [Stellaceae bacterium]